MPDNWRTTVAWLLVIVAGVFETGFALSLNASDGFKKLWPTVLFCVCALASFGLLTVSLKHLPVGSAYAVWTGIGAAGTAAAGILFQGDPASALRVTALVLIVAGVVLLPLTGGHSAP
ncbi:MAG TPA: multidrug efflux SMR transporter [Acidimicrobiales bacterium]|nr:multidrug efflux SMR transporter [Acidimicrobiales bacterium]